MKEKELENIFKEAFQDFEAPVDPSVWSGIEKGLDASSSAGSSSAANDGGSSFLSGLGSGSGLGITAAGIGAVAIALVSYLMLSEPNTTANEAAVQESQSISETVEPVAEENNTLDITDNTPVEVDKESNIENSVGETQRKIEEKEKRVSPLLNSAEDKIATSTNTVDPGTVASSENSSDATSKKLGNMAAPEAPLPQEKSNIVPEPNKEIQEVIEIHKTEPVAFIDANPVSGTAPLLVNFNNVGYAEQHNWNFGDGVVINSGGAVVHQFQEPGIYEVVLTANDGSDNEDVNTITIEVREPEVLESEASVLGKIPNVFTPNGDGKNDAFKVPNQHLESLDISIFDKRGRVVYEWKHLEDEWDGKMGNGSEAASGTYFYILKAVGKDQKGYEHRGSVTLFR